MNRLLTFRNLTMALAFALACFSCSSDDENETFSPDEYPMDFSASVEGLAMTKLTSNNTWDGGESVAVKVGSNVKEYTAAADGKLTVKTGGTPFYWQNQTETKSVEAWYPYSATAPATWSVASDQSSVTAYQQSDLLYAAATDISFANRTSTSLPFYHQTAKVVINILNAEAATNATQISSVRIGINNNLALSATYNTPTGANVTQGTWTNTPSMGHITPKEVTPTGTNLKSYEALVIPQDMTSKKFIAVTLSNGNTYYYIPTGNDANLVGGKQHTYNITVKKGYLEVEVGNSTAWTNDGNETIASKEVKASYTASDLKPGDYYYRAADGTWATSDGGLRKIYTDGTVERESVSPDNTKGTVVGIVFWVGDPTKSIHNNGTAFTDFGDTNLPTTCTHGLVVALQDASAGTVWQAYINPYPQVGTWTAANTSYGSIATDIGANDNLNKLRGYSNTQAIRAYNAANPNSKVLAVEEVDTWISLYSTSTIYPAPTGSSGWYLPSAKELTLLCGRDVNNIGSNYSGGTTMRNIVNASITNTNHGPLAEEIAIDYPYWSSWEYASYTYHAFYVNFFDGGVKFDYKYSPGRVRCVQAF